MAARQKENFCLLVKKYTFLGCQSVAITDSFLQNHSSDGEEDLVKWLRVERLKKDGECVVFEKIYERPLNVHDYMRFLYFIDAEGLMKEVDTKLQASALATGLGAYIIAFPLDSFAEDVPETSRLDLVREIWDSVSVIKESLSGVVLDQTPQLILLGTHKGTVDPTKVERRQKVVIDLLKQEYFGDVANCNFVRTPESDIVWAIDGSDSNNSFFGCAE